MVLLTKKNIIVVYILYLECVFWYFVCIFAFNFDLNFYYE